MSKSRLEKFLYALYSLDSSDLPTPLSRIEELYKCWVTGEEAPSFEPISRVEKYLMAILGVYDVNELPNPLSRVEVLLHKLAIGDDNLDDIKSFLSEHEELLAEIIRNGGAGGNINIEYVLYTLSTEFNTLYNTAEKPVKSAILNGVTLVNLFDGEKMALNESSHYTYSNGIIKSAVDGLPWSSKTNLSSAIIPNTKYLLKVKNVGEHNLNVQIRTDLSTLLISQAVSVDQEVIKIITTGRTINGLYAKVYPRETGDGIYAQAKINIIKYQEGMENWDIPYFEGIQSVKMPVLTTTGNNLFDKEKHKLNPNFGAPQTYYGTDYIKVKPLTTYTRNNQTSLTFHTNYGDTTLLSSSSSTTFTTTAETNYIRYNVLKTEIDTHQLEEGSVATPYEPYKSNILTVNEEVELRGIGDVRDELDLLTGEVVNKFGEIVLNGDESWGSYGSIPNQVNTVAFRLSHANHASSWGTGLGYCNKLLFTNGVAIYDQDLEGVTTDANNIIIRINTSKASSVDEFKAWLSNNNLEIVYPIKEEVIKTVDLSVVDQDGNNTKLSTFNDITYVTLSSEGLIPEAELKVATKNKEVLSTMSLEMNDISTTQNALQKTSDIQSENVDATMIATTEIYEELL